MSSSLLVFQLSGAALPRVRFLPSHDLPSPTGKAGRGKWLEGGRVPCGNGREVLQHFRSQVSMSPGSHFWAVTLLSHVTGL